MKHESQHPKPPIQLPEPPRPKPRKRRPRKEVSQEQRDDIVRLNKLGFTVRGIAKKTGLGRKVVLRVHLEMGLVEIRTPSSNAQRPKPASKLDPFKERIKEKIVQNLTTTRILREIQPEGYTGGRTILADYIRKNTATPRPKKKVWRRFETDPAEETQFDWSPYRVCLGERERVVHAFGATLGFCRKIHVRFYMDEREPTLLEAHTYAFADFGGVTKRGVYDRMSTVVLGTIGKDRMPLWHPRFLEFTRFYGFEPYLCKVRDPDRKGKDERVFWYLERDFLRGSTFDSLEDLNNKVRLWLDNVANCRVHGTTRRIPDEAWEQERPFLIALPESPYPACEEALRKVGPDAVISVRGTPYTIPAELAHKTVSVRLFSAHFEVLDPKGEVAFSRPYVPDSEKGKLVIDSRHYENVRPRSPIPGGSAAALEEAFCTRFPSLEDLVLGIKKKMKGLTHIHLRILWRLADRYGEEIFLPIAERVQTFRRFDAQAIRRILERDHPLTDDAPTVTPLTAAARLLASLGDVDPGSLDDYAHLDSQSNNDDDNPDNDNDEGENHGNP
jgi:transposase